MAINDGLAVHFLLYWICVSVVSACVVSLEGRAHVGVVADSRAVPNAASIPNAFVSHLNELAVDKGIRM